MGKFMRKSKLTPEVSVMEMMSKSTLGVRTRAKTLALQSLDSKPDYCYLQLRSRRLEKPNPFLSNHGPKPPQPGFRVLTSGSTKGGKMDNTGGFPGIGDEQFGENNLDFQPIERAIRESTPSNPIKGVDSISPPGSSTSTKCPSSTTENQRPRSSILTNIPSTCEVDDLFAHFEQQQQREFMKKYNFDIINDIPLQGRYDWVKVNP